MGSAAVTVRLREVATRLAARGFVSKAVDMSEGAVTARLRSLGALSDLCRRLGALDVSGAHVAEAAPVDEPPRC